MNERATSKYFYFYYYDIYVSIERPEMYYKVVSYNMYEYSN